MQKYTRTKIFFRILVIILISIPLIGLVVSTYTLLIGKESLGLTLIDLSKSSPIDFLNSYFMEYIPRFIGMSIFFLVGCYSLEFITTFMEGCFLFPYASTLLILFISMVVAGILMGIIFWLANIQKIMAILRIISWIFLSIYVTLAVLFGSFFLMKITELNSLKSEYEQLYTFSDLKISRYFLYFEKQTDSGLGHRYNLSVANFDNTRKKILTSINLPENNYAKPQFPSPKGTYHLIVNTESGEISDSHVLSLDGSNVFTIPEYVSNYSPGVVHWSPDERYLAVYSKKIEDPEVEGRLFIYDIKLKKEAAFFDGTDYGQFTWAGDDILYYTCGPAICRVSFKDGGLSAGPTMLGDTLRCENLVYLNEKIFCSVGIEVVEKILGKKMQLPDSRVMREHTASTGYSYLISLDVNSKGSLKDKITIINTAPFYSAIRSLHVLDSSHLIAYMWLDFSFHFDSYILVAVDLESGRIKDVGVKGSRNIFYRSADIPNNPDMPILYQREGL